MEWKLIIHTTRPLGTQNKHSLGEKETEVCWGYKGDGKVVGQNWSPVAPLGSQGAQGTTRPWPDGRRARFPSPDPTTVRDFLGGNAWLSLSSCLDASHAPALGTELMKTWTPCLTSCAGPRDWSRRDNQSQLWDLSYGRRISLASNGQHEKWGVEWRAEDQYSVM